MIRKAKCRSNTATVFPAASFHIAEKCARKAANRRMKMKLLYRRHRRHILEKARAWRREHPGESAARQRQWRREHAERYRASARERYRTRRNLELALHPRTCRGCGKKIGPYLRWCQACGVKRRRERRRKGLILKQCQACGRIIHGRTWCQACMRMRRRTQDRERRRADPARAAAKHRRWRERRKARGL